MPDPGSAVAAAYADGHTRIVAALIRVTGDWTLAEDCAQEALAAALERWPVDGVPANPGGWLMTVARNRAIDVLRRAAALLALFLFQHSRRDARADAEGNLLTLDRHDRARWDHAAIREGVDVLSRVTGAGPYALQARIAACHATARSSDRTDWPMIATTYDQLARVQPSPVIALNRAVAHGYAYGPEVGLRLLAEARTGSALDDYPPAYAVEADLTARAGDRRRAADPFRRAAAMAGSEPERRALRRRIDELAEEIE